MMVRFVCLAALGFVLAVTAPASAVEAKDLAGTYQVKGKEGKDEYEATVVVTHHSGKVVIITYKSGKSNWVGLGKLEGSKLRVTWERVLKDEAADRWNYQLMGDKIVYAAGKWQETWTKK